MNYLIFAYGFVCSLAGLLAGIALTKGIQKINRDRLQGELYKTPVYPTNKIKRLK